MDVSKKAISLVIVLLAVIIGGALLFREQSASGIKDKRDSLVQDVFPSLNNNPRFFVDPSDSDILWLYGGGVIVSYDLIKKEIRDTYTAEAGINSRLTSATKVGDHIFHGYQGGFKKLNLETGKVSTYTEEDGLVSGSNIDLFPDPADKNVIWIGTFRGLSKFNIATESFDNFDDEISQTGTQWGVNGVKVGKEYVWVIISANAYNTGAIARYDKNGDTWKWWGPADFGVKDRIDVYDFDGNEEGASVEVDNDLYKYDPVNDKWDMFIDGGERSSLQSGFVYTEGCLYGIWESGHNDHELRCVSEEGEVIKSFSVGSFDRYLFDKLADRIILTSGWYSFKDTQDIPYGVYDLKTNTYNQFSLKFPSHFNSYPIGIFDNKLLYKSGKNLYQYDVNSSQHKIVEGADFVSDTARAIEVNGKIVVQSINEGMDGVTGPTLLYFDNNTGVLVKKVVLEGGLLEPGSKELYFINYDRDLKKFHGKKLDLYKIESVLADGEISESELVAASGEEVHKFNSSQGRYYEIEVEINEKAARFLVDRWSTEGNDVYTSLTIDGVTSTTTITVAPPKYNSFGWPPSVEVADVQIDYLDPDVVWIAIRDRGLVKINIKTKTSKLFSVSNGLSSNSIMRIFPGERQLVLHDIGTYIYNLD